MPFVEVLSVCDSISAGTFGHIFFKLEMADIH
jgi:hypothetical protein